MAFKTFVTFHALEAPISDLDPAIRLAVASNAHLDVIVFGVLMTPPIVLHDVAPAAEWVEHNNEIVNSATRVVKEIEAYLDEKGVSGTVDAECDYPVRLEKLAARYSLCADAHVATKQSLNSYDIAAKALNGTLFDARCPFLLLPDSETNPEPASRVAVAWNGKAEAAQAVRSAVPLLKNAERVNVIVIDPKESDVGEDAGSDIAVFLSRYGIKVTVDVLASGGKSVTEKLLQRATDIDADLLVMGAYGHTKFREWLLGGATHDMLESASIPVFMVH